MRLRAKTTGIAIFFIQGMATVYVYIAPIMLNAPGLGLSNTGTSWTFLSAEEWVAYSRISVLLGRHRNTRLLSRGVLCARNQGSILYRARRAV